MLSVFLRFEITQKGLKKNNNKKQRYYIMYL